MRLNPNPAITPLLLLLLAAAPAGIAGGPVGAWANTDAATKTITRIIISDHGDIHVYAKCHPTDCDWNSVPMQSLGNDHYTAEFKTSFETNTLNIFWVKEGTGPEGRLKVKVTTQHAAQNGQRAWTKVSPELTFAKLPEKVRQGLASGWRE
jgi:hypothetical protein